MTRTVLFLSLLIAGLACLSLGMGEQSLSPAQIGAVLFGTSDDSPAAAMIVIDIRLPRLLLALLAGMVLAVAGALAQTVLQNPLAEPGLIGINAGAALAALVGLVVFRVASPHVLALSAFAGAFALAVAIYGLSLRDGANSIRLILVGIGLSSLCGAGASFISAFGDVDAVQRASVWLSGTLYLASWAELRVLAIVVGPVLLGLGCLTAKLDLLAFEADVASALGQRVELMRGVFLLLCALLSASAVAVTGLIGFVGLIAPHIARTLVGHASVRMLPIAALVGAGILVAADLAGRTIAAPVQLPAGLITALVGAPFFAYLFWKSRNAADA